MKENEYGEKAKEKDRERKGVGKKEERNKG